MLSKIKLEAIEQFLNARRTVVHSIAGDRRDCDIIRQGQILGEEFDRVILYEDHYTRGRSEGEIIALMRQGLAGATRAKQVEEVRGSVNAVKLALDSASPGELLLVQADEIDETMEFVRQYVEALSPAKPEPPVMHAPSPTLPLAVTAVVPGEALGPDSGGEDLSA